MMKNLSSKLLTISGILVVLIAGIQITVPVQAQTLTVDFTAVPTSGEPPLTVQFTDQSTGDPTGWAWYFGDEDCSAAWEEVTPSGAWWSKRFGHTSVVLPGGNIVLMGGTDGSGNMNDVWRSTDGGDTWALVTAGADWSPRSGHSSVVMPDGSIVLMGGFDSSYNNKNDVWRSTDGGETWTALSTAAGWSGRYVHTSVVLPDGTIVLMGGYDGSWKNDIWRSTDGGATWTELTASADWSARYLHTSVVLPDGSIVLMGGDDGSLKNDVWRSVDGGANWTQVTPSGDWWSGREGHTSVVLPDGSIVLMGGLDGSLSNKNDVWRSDDDGATWTQVNASAGWLARRYHTSVVLPDGRIVLMGGFRGSNMNDVWRLVTAGSHEQDPEHTYTEPGTYSVTLQAYKANGMSKISKPDYIDVQIIPVEADFSAVPTSGEPPLEVQFTDQSSGDPTGWAWYFGDEDYSAAWEAVTPSGDWWSARWGHTSVVLPDGSIVLMGGHDNNYKNDVWRSTDGGVTWEEATDNAGWSGRLGHTSVVLPDGSIVLMGGNDRNWKNDVWRSTDGGVTWEEATANAGWSGRYYHTSVVLPDGSILVIGGNSGTSDKNDVWRSDDKGTTWTEVTSSAGWPWRYGHTSVVMPDGSILMMGGVSGVSYKNDVWRSDDDGETWIQVTLSAGWSVRGYHTSVVLPNGNIVLMGGLTTNFINDVWYSVNGGVTWTQLTASAEWLGRCYHTSVVLPDGYIVLMGGYDPGNKNDVWRLETAGSNEQNPEQVYTEPGTYTVTLQTYNANGVSRISKPDYIHVQFIPPQADFTAAPTSGEPPLPVQFTDQSTGDPTGWAWYFGDEDLSATWEEAAPSGAWWSKRFIHSSVVLPDGNIVLMGGNDGSGNKNDVWRSSDGGDTWALVTTGADWSPRHGHTSVVLPDGSIVLMGGSDGGVHMNDVWRSTDGGATWTALSTDAGWSERYIHTSVVLPDGTIVLMGGYDGSWKNDIWRSTDGGANWTELRISADWSARYLHTSVVLPDGSIVLMGGYDGSRKNDVWRSTDGGETWTALTTAAEWSGREGHTSVVLPDGSIVLMGGLDGSLSNKNDVWRSDDHGATWTQVNASSGWSARRHHSTVVLPDGRIVLIGGYDTSGKNDVWRLETAGSHEQNPEHIYTEQGTYSVTLQAYNTNGVSRITKQDLIDVFTQDDHKIYLPLILR